MTNRLNHGGDDVPPSMTAIPLTHEQNESLKRGERITLNAEQRRIITEAGKPLERVQAQVDKIADDQARKLGVSAQEIAARDSAPDPERDAAIAEDMRKGEALADQMYRDIAERQADLDPSALRAQLRQIALDLWHAIPDDRRPPQCAVAATLLSDWSLIQEPGTIPASVRSAQSVGAVISISLMSRVTPPVPLRVETVEQMFPDHPDVVEHCGSCAIMSTELQIRGHLRTLTPRARAAMEASRREMNPASSVAGLTDPQLHHAHWLSHLQLGLALKVALDLQG